MVAQPPSSLSADQSPFRRNGFSNVARRPSEVQTFDPLSFDQGKHRLCLAGIVVDLDRVRADKVCRGDALGVFDGLKKARIVRRNVAEAMRFSTRAAGLTQVMQSELHDREVCRSCEGIKLCSEVFRGDRPTNCNIEIMG